MVKMRKATILEDPSPFTTYVCNGCGYEYDPEMGDPDADVSPGTPFEALPEEWLCPMCAEDKDSFVKVNTGYEEKEDQ